MHLYRHRQRRNALSRLSPEDIRRICRTIHRHVEIEATKADAAKRNARLRMLIGLPPFPRRRVTKAHARAVQ
jgi:hypothetical protein